MSAPAQERDAATATKNLSYSRAINQALAEEMRRDERVFLMGQDVGRLGGVFGVTRSLLDEFGARRVYDTAINETFIVGGAVGAALVGARPVAEVQFADFLFCAADEVFLKMAKWRYIHGGQFTVPMVLRCPTGIMGGAGAEHSASLEALCMHTPGLRVAVPTTPADAKGLLKTAIRDENPVVFFEHKMLYREKGPVPVEDSALIPFGRAALRRAGHHVTIVATGLMMNRTLEAAERVAGSGIEVEIIDPRTLVPLDIDSIVKSVVRTGRAMVVHEAVRTGGAGAEIAAQIQERAFFALDAPVWRLGALDTPIPQSSRLEQYCVPSADDIERAVRELVAL